MFMSLPFSFSHLYMGCDHAGFALKEHLKAYTETLGLDATDYGCYDENAVDYPDVARLVCEAVLANPGSAGLLVCGSGVGMSIAANRYNGLRAVLCFDSYIAHMSRAHNNANVLCLGGRVTAPAYAEVLLETFVTGEFEGERHMTRLNKLDGLVPQAQTELCS
jgi:ribose 5-phosphate isomerase B